MPPQPRVGGSFAPPLLPETVSKYRELAEAAPPEIGEVMLKLCDMVELFQQTPRSKLPGSPHPSGRGQIVPLEKEEIERIDNAVPWAHECDMYAALFETLPTGVEGYQLEEIELPDGTKGRVNRAVVADKEAKALRDAAFHLLWEARELTLDREPLHSDQL